MRPGPAPKDPSARAGRTTAAKDKRNGVRTNVVSMHKHPAPQLSKSRTLGWPDETHDWWDMWTRSPLTAEFTEEDWSELCDTAMLHAFVWTPEHYGSPSWFKAMQQLRQRTANYGATPLDRQRLRIQVVFADDAEKKQAERKGGATAPTGSSRKRRGPLTEAG